MWIQTMHGSWVNSDYVKEFYVHAKEINAWFGDNSVHAIDRLGNDDEAHSELTQIMSKIMQGSKAITYSRLKAMNDKKGIDND